MSAAIDTGYLPQEKLVINHDIMNCTAEGVVGNHLYSGRALGLSTPGDIIQLHPELQTHWDAIAAHYHRIGLPHTDSVIWDLDLRHLAAHIGHRPSVFYFGPAEYANWGDDRWLDTVEYINSKNNFMALADELGVDVPRTLCFDSAAQIDTETRNSFPYPCYLKAAVSVSGVGIYRCEDVSALEAAISRFDAGVPVQLQEEIVTQTFLNLQYRVVNNRLTRLTASEQILDGFVHQGNRVPASHEPWQAVDVMAQWLKDRGIRGIFAFDVAVVQTPQGLRFPAIECNPRYNGASYPTLIARKLAIPRWSSITLTTRHRSLEAIDLSGIEYNPKTARGVILVNWGTVAAGKLMVLLAGTAEQQEALRLVLDQRL